MAYREVGALLGLAALGGLWAAAWGARRAQRTERVRMVDARTQLQVRLDALRARTAALARGGGLSPAGRSLVDAAVERQVMIDSTLSRAATPDDIATIAPELAAAESAIAAASELAGHHVSLERPFSGLCGMDPGHGQAVTEITTPEGIFAVCSVCADAAGDGDVPHRRMVSVEGRPVPFDEA
jgi:hypothetical protein